ncbi:hypothetical protein AB4291_16580 [Vibrio cyclitrophicus]
MEENGNIKPIDMPHHLKVLRFFLCIFTNRTFVIVLSISIIFLTYLFDLLNQEHLYLSSGGTIITAFGLILTIKNSYLNNIRDTESLVSSYYQESQMGGPVSEVVQEQLYMAKLFEKATDEGTGLLLVIIGTLLNAFSPFIPLIPICS